MAGFMAVTMVFRKTKEYFIVQLRMESFIAESFHVCEQHGSLRHDLPNCRSFGGGTLPRIKKKQAIIAPKKVSQQHV